MGGTYVIEFSMEHSFLGGVTSPIEMGISLKLGLGSIPQQFPVDKMTARTQGGFWGHKKP